MNALFDFIRFSVEWGQESNFPKFQQLLTKYATEGFISLGVIAAGIIIALIFGKKWGFILVLSGLGYIAHLFGII